MWTGRKYDVLINLVREMSIGNTFGATSLSSFGGFWISIAIILTPGGFDIVDSYDSLEFQHAFALFLFVRSHPLISDYHALLTVVKSGMVHLHYHSPRVHSFLLCSALFYFLHSRPRLPLLGSRSTVPISQRLVVRSK